MHTKAGREDGTGKKPREGLCEEATKNGYIDASDAQIRTYEAKHYFYPIPTTQLTLNKNMKQNPGW